MNTEQKLGIKVFYYYLFQKVLIGLIFFAVCIFLSSFKSVVVSQMSYFLGFDGALAVVSYFIDGLFIFSILLIAGGFFISWLDYISYTFVFDEASFNIKRGIINKKEISIPYRQVQDIDIEQTLLNKLMGVSKLVILTAGNDEDDKEGEAEGVFQIIDSKVAEKMREEILQKSSIQNVKEIKS